MYMAGTSVEAGIWGRAFTILGVRVASGTSSSWFNLAEACWAVLQKQDFGIMTSSSRWLDYYKGLIVAKCLNC